MAVSSGINFPSEIELQGSLCLLIDGLVLVSAVGRPSVTQKFGEIAFKQQFLKLDPAISTSTSYLIGIKKIPSSEEREKDAQSPIVLSEMLLNKAMALSSQLAKRACLYMYCQIHVSDLVRFLSEHIIVIAPPEKVVVAAVGFVDGREVQSPERAIDMSL